MALMKHKITAQERKYEEQAIAEREERRNRFRILVCIDGSEKSHEGLRFARKIGGGPRCDTILLFVRPIDQGLRSGGLQIRVARQNMLDWGLELPGIEYLRKALEILRGRPEDHPEWQVKYAHRDAFGDPLGDNKVEYTGTKGRKIVLKLKTAPDAAAGILDQYELGPYNVIVMGEPSRWQGELKAFVDAGPVQKVAMLSPCSVMIARPETKGAKGYLVCTDGTDHSNDSAYRAAVLANHCKEPVTLFTVAKEPSRRKALEEMLARVAKEMKQRGIKQKITTKVGNGDPVAAIIKASAGHALICVSDSGKSRLRRFLVGSVSFDVLGQAPISVLNVH